MATTRTRGVLPRGLAALAAGFTHVADLAGGITAWTAAGHTLVTS